MHLGLPQLRQFTQARCRSNLPSQCSNLRCCSCIYFRLCSLLLTTATERSTLQGSSPLQLSPRTACYQQPPQQHTQKALPRHPTKQRCTTALLELHRPCLPLPSALPLFLTKPHQ